MTINREMFQIQERDGLRLITPLHQAAVANAPWSRDTLKYRSRVETLAGETVSQGFSKFFNLNSGPLDLQIGFDDVVRAAERGDAVATLKLDGSLLIRSVYNGKVMLRTRGSFGWEHLDNAHEMSLFEQEYPRLFNPLWFRDVSLLFEWTSPNNVIVLKYDQPELTLIGAVSHDTLDYIDMSLLHEISCNLEVPCVEYFPLTPEGWARLNGELDARGDIEGYVIRINGEQDLVKVKCAPYLTKHALKSTLSTERLVDMWWDLGQPDFLGFCEAFKSSFDEETCLWALGAISALFDGLKVYTKIIEHMRGKVFERPSWSKKEAALAGLAEYGQTKRFSAYMNLWLGKEVPKEILKSIILQNTRQVEVGMFRATSVVDEDDN